MLLDVQFPLLSRGNTVPLPWLCLCMKNHLVRVLEKIMFCLKIAVLVATKMAVQRSP